MAPLNVHIKHAGKTHDVSLDPELPPKAFKEAVYQVTGVPVERMKVMVKGGVLKDDTPWAKIAPKAGQTFMVIGAAGELPKAPEKPMVFLEDLDDEELASALVKPVGLKNLGNTCYMNSTVQALRAIPELQVALNAPQPTSGSSSSSAVLPPSLRDLYSTMGRTTDSVAPYAFLGTLRQVNPQFGEMDRNSSGVSRGYAQQDAEECYSQILNSLRDVNVPPPSGSSSAVVNTSGRKFIEQYLVAEVERELKNTESEDEPPTVTREKVMKIECNISISTNYMSAGINSAMQSTLEKHSPTLNRTAVYTQTSRITRLPAYLTVHMVRFAWRADVGRKAKIMRKVKFPTTYDALDIVSPQLKEKVLPVSRRLQEILKERDERRKVRKRSKAPISSAEQAQRRSQAETTVRNDITMGSSTEEGAGEATATAIVTPAVDAILAAREKGENQVTMKVDGQSVVVAGGELEDEEVYRQRERKELMELVGEEVRNDLGSSWTGLYELVAIITHKGAAADSGHYIGFAKKSVFKGKKPTPTAGPSSSSESQDVDMADASAPAAGSSTSTVEEPISGGGINPNLSEDNDYEAEDDEDWYKFDDDKVSVFPKEKLTTLDGGGEDSSAYVLLYRTKSF